MQAVLGGEIQGLLSLSDLYLFTSYAPINGLFYLTHLGVG